MITSSTKSALLLALLLSVLLRLAVAFYLGDTVPPAKDELSYSTLATRLATGHGYSFGQGWYPFAPPDAPTAHWSFLYTAFVAAVYTVVGVHPIAVRLVSALIAGLLLPWLLYRLTQRLFHTDDEPPSKMAGTIPIVAAALSAVYIYFVLFAAMVQTEAFFIPALVWSLERSLTVESYLRARRAPPTSLLASQGLSLGLATLLRQSILPWVGVLCLWLLWVGYRQGQLRPALRATVASSVILVLAILPVTVRNYRVYGDFLLLNSNAGYAMYSAQHPMHGTDFQEFDAAPLPTDLDPIPVNEVEWDQALMQRGLQFIRDDPIRYLRLSLSRISDYLMFWPSPNTTLVNNIGRVASFGLLLPFMLYGLWCSRVEWRRYRLLYLFITFYSLLHIFTWAMIRYRLPVDAVLLIFASLGLYQLYQRVTGWLGRRNSSQTTAVSG